MRGYNDLMRERKALKSQYQEAQDPQEREHLAERIRALSERLTEMDAQVPHGSKYCMYGDYYPDEEE